MLPLFYLKNQKSKISIDYNRKIEIIIILAKRGDLPPIFIPRCLSSPPLLVDPLEFTYWRNTRQSSMPSWTNTRYLSLA